MKISRSLFACSLVVTATTAAAGQGWTIFAPGAQVPGDRTNAILAIDPTATEQEANVAASGMRGRLVGKHILIKDNIEVAGMPTTAGSLALKDNNTGRDAPLITRLRAAGMVIVGKTNLSEWANIRDNASISGWSAVGGQTRNPYALDRDPCGSSSGSGAAVAAGITNYAIGTETNGSITCPASINGIVGLKPSVGLVSRTRIVPISVTQDTAGPMTRTVREAAELLTAIAGTDPADPATVEADSRKVDYATALIGASLKGKRLGLMRFASGFGTDKALDQALAVLRAQGAEIVEIKELGGAKEEPKQLPVLLTEFKVGLNAYLATTPPAVKTRTLADVIAFNKADPRELALFGQDLFEKAEATKGLSDPDYIKARDEGIAYAGINGIDRLLRDNKVDALIGPTESAAWLIDAVHGDQYPGGGAGYLAAIAGYPHLTVPMGLVKGLPVGLSFIGPKWSEAELLRLGYAYEQARGPFPGPRFLPSIEQAPEIAPLLEKPVRR
ncbi:amidase [Sphingomonas sp.]|uniref:amidase n=1 Tax=Sphingomonas sp. TaxID=28214 RepID=UPI0025EE3EB5|nr:amidase [Sphingomonas sp.]